MKIESLKELHNLGVSYCYACVLQTAVKLKVCTHLGNGEMEAEELARLMDTIAGFEEVTALFYDAPNDAGLVRARKKGCVRGGTRRPLRAISEKASIGN